MTVTKRTPQIGDAYCPVFEDSFGPGLELLTIAAVEDDYEDGGFCIVASDGVGYDCYWSEAYQIWLYFVPR